MSDPGCTGPDCTFRGPSSGAQPGNCTGKLLVNFKSTRSEFFGLGTPGYLSNTEIYAIINSGVSIQQFMADEASDILVYDNDNWVAWMKGSTYDTRSQWAQSLGFAGTSDWVCLPS